MGTGFGHFLPPEVHRCPQDVSQLALLLCDKAFRPRYWGHGAAAAAAAALCHVHIAESKLDVVYISHLASIKIVCMCACTRLYVCIKCEHTL